MKVKVKVHVKPKVSISIGNKKMGKIPSVSLPPIITCPVGCPCAKKCYAVGLCRRRKNVALAYQNNLMIYLENPDEYFKQITEAAMLNTYFRWHVSGDIVDRRYFLGVIQVAKDLPHTNFLIFTKKYDIVNDYLAAGFIIPENLVVVFSLWDDEHPVPNPFNLPIARVIFKGDEPDPTWMVCGGNCMNCICRGIGCWVLKCGDIIAMHEHK